MTPLGTKLFKFFLVGCFVATFAVGMVSISPLFRQISDLKAKRADIQHQIAEKREETRSIREQRTRFETDRGFAESIARQNRLVYPGEIVFEFDD